MAYMYGLMAYGYGFLLAAPTLGLVCSTVPLLTSNQECRLDLLLLLLPLLLLE